MTHFTIFVAGHNVEEYIDRCMASITAQVYDDFDVVVVNDASTDNTTLRLKRWCCDTRVTLHANESQSRMPRNLLHLLVGIPEDVVVIVDADDYLPHDHVLANLATYYDDPDLWLTYGSYTRDDPSWDPNPAAQYPAGVIQCNAFRYYSEDWYCLYNHPITFKRWLFQQLTDDELQDDDGNWFTAAYDHVIMMPMLEMASRGHFKFVPEVLYVYNEHNPASEARVMPEEGRRTHTIVNGRTPRAPI